MTTVPVYDPHSMEIAAGQVERLRDEFERSKAKVTGVDHEKDSPFGTMGGSAGVHGAVGTFKQGVHKEFDAAGAHMTAASSALRRAVMAMQETDQVAASDLEWHEDR
jgi:hypothetical protein